MRDHLVRTRTWPIGTYAKSSPYWLKLQPRKARSGRPVSMVFRGTDTNVERWTVANHRYHDSYERNLGGWRLEVRDESGPGDGNRFDWFARPCLEDYKPAKHGSKLTLAEAMKACEEAAR